MRGDKDCGRKRKREVEKKREEEERKRETERESEKIDDLDGSRGKSGSRPQIDAAVFPDECTE